jgi:hypothetical protein
MPAPCRPLPRSRRRQQRKRRLANIARIHLHERGFAARPPRRHQRAHAAGCESRGHLRSAPACVHVRHCCWRRQSRSRSLTCRVSALSAAMAALTYRCQTRTAVVLLTVVIVALVPASARLDWRVRVALCSQSTFIARVDERRHHVAVTGYSASGCS